MVSEERQPSLHRVWISRGSPDPSRDTPFREIETQLEQFAVNARRSPGWILSNHTEDQGANLFADTLPSSYLADSGDPRPIQTKSRSMPVHDGSRSDQDERLPPPGPAHSQRNPEQFVQGSQSTARSLPCRASNCRRRARFSRTRSARQLKELTNQPRKCRSDTIMARILAEKTESSFAPSHSFRRCTTFWRGTGLPPDGVERNDSQSSGVLNIKAETRARIMGKLSTHTHECPRCGAKWKCGEANFQDECPYPIKTLCTKCWAQGPARAASLREGKE